MANIKTILRQQIPWAAGLSVEQRNEMAAQIETFFGLAILSMIVAAIHWRGEATGGWGNWINWLGRAFDTLLCLILSMVLWLKQKKEWKWALIFLGVSLPTLWIGFLIAAVSISFGWFIGIFTIIFAYIVWLFYCLFRNRWLTEKGCTLINNIVGKVVIARKIAWMAVLLVGILQAWVEMYNYIGWFCSTIIAFLSLIIVGILFFYEIKKDDNPKED